MDALQAALHRRWGPPPAANADAGGKAKRKKKPPSRADEELAMAATLPSHPHRNKQASWLTAIEFDGVKPLRPSEWFVAYGDDNYNVPSNHVVSTLATSFRNLCRLSVSARAFSGRSVTAADGSSHFASWDGAGMPEQLAVCVSEEEAAFKRWSDPKTIKKQTKTKAPVVTHHPEAPPGPADFELMHPRHGEVWTCAEVLARYLRGEALLRGDAEAFVRFFMSIPVDATTRKLAAASKAEHPDKWAHERERFGRRLDYVYWISPEPVANGIGPNGELYPLGAFERARDEGTEPEPLVVSYKDTVVDEHGVAHEVHYEDVRGTIMEGYLAPQPFVLAGLAPACVAWETPKDRARRAEQRSGFHSTQRGYLIAPAAVALIKHYIAHYELQAEHPLFAALHPLRCEQTLNLAALRARARAAHGPPPMPGPGYSANDADANSHWISRKWLAERSEIAFDPPWITRCTLDYPGGIPDTTGPEGSYKLSVCHKGRAIDLNDHPWLDLELNDKDVHYEARRAAIAYIMGRGGVAEPLSTDDAREVAEAKERATKAEAALAHEQARKRLRTSKDDDASSTTAAAPAPGEVELRAGPGERSRLEVTVAEGDAEIIIRTLEGAQVVTSLGPPKKIYRAEDTQFKIAVDAPLGAAGADAPAGLRNLGVASTSSAASARG